MLIQSALHNLPLKPLATCLLVPFAIGNLACSSVVAATLPVTNCDDTGNGSLREALASAHSGDSVDLTALTCATISLATGTLRVAVDDLTLRGPGANALTIASTDSNFAYGVLAHTGLGTLRVDALRITDNYSTYYGDYGYGYGYGLGARSLATATLSCIRSTGTVYLNRSTVTKCRSGGIYSVGFTARDSTISDSSQGVSTLDGDVSIINSTISGNSSYGSCVALRLGLPAATSKTNVLINNSTISGNYSSAFYNRGTNSAGCILGRTTISNSTIAFNGTLAGAGGLFIAGPEITIESSILAHNSLGDLSIPGATGFSGRNNVIVETAAQVPPGTIRTDPLLLPLANNGGPTLTHALAGGSPAIDAGSNPAGLPTDQRGPPFARSAGAAPDIGAFESQTTTTASVSIGPGFTGTWFDPAQSGHGLMLEVLPGNGLLAIWFSFNPAGDQQSWFGGVGTYSGATATITDVAQPTGGRWIPNFDPDSIVRSPWGTLTFTFTDCDHGRVDFNSGLGYGSGSMNLLRLTQPAGLACP